ncbi:MAG: AMP-binding protein [Lyngbya sp.]|nr:AMP-binding protein [Lyngbya sp.]
MIELLESTVTNPAQATTLVELLKYRAATEGDRIGYIFLSDGETDEIRLSYAALDRQARAIAAQLQGLRGQRALLLYPPSLEYISALFGCFYAGVVAVPAYPPRRNSNLLRLQSIIADAQASVILTTTPLLENIQKLATNCVIATDNLTPNFSSQTEPKITPETLAFLQYTSGSTGNPKGVMLSHSNLIQNSKIIHHCFEHTPKSRCVIWLPPYHDMGLIGGILQPFYGGFPVILMSPVHFLQKPIRWLQTISRYQATTSGAPNFAYQLCLQKIKPKQLKTLDLSSWDVAFVGAEPIQAQTLENFAETFASCGFRSEAFYPCYGLAEATLFVSGGKKSNPPIVETVERKKLAENVIVEPKNSADSQKTVGCGQVKFDYNLEIVHPESLTPCSEGGIGEIWLSGESVTPGYWQQTELTQQSFQAYLSTGEGPFLRTGDLGFIKNGELFVTGRLKEVIIIRGCNYYPQDIEQTVQESNPSLRTGCGAAFGVKKEGEERLVIVQEVERTALKTFDVNHVIEKIRRAVSEQHQLQVYEVVFLKPGAIPKTTSGKIKRYACRTEYLENSLNAIKDSRSSQSDAQQNISTEKTDQLIEWLRTYANEQINSRLIDERRCIPPDIVLDFGNQGLLGMQVPSEYGGLGLNNIETLRILEQLGAIDTTLALFVGLNNILGIRPILKFGNNTLKAELLPKLATGRELAAFALTEPSAGSNPQAIESTATNNSGGWLLNGSKIWSGSAAWAGAINVFVKHPEAGGISGFVVRRGTPGLRQGPEALTMGMRGMVQNAVYLNDVLVDKTSLLDGAGKGLSVAQDAMMYGRLAIAAASIGGMKRCAQLMLRYSQRRVISTGRLINNPFILSRLNQLTVAITAIQTLVNRIAKLLDQGLSVPVEAYTACKTAGPEFYWQAADDLVQILGGRGYIETNFAPQILRDARVLRIFEGPTETLNFFLGSRVLNNSQELEQFMSQTLGAPEVYQRLIKGAEKIRARTSIESFSSLQTRQWISIKVGELATLAILWAALHGENSTFKTIKRSLNWIKLNFEQKLTQAISSTPSDAVVSRSDETTDLIYSYIETIGDLEQTLVGEDLGVDEFLRKYNDNVALIKAEKNQQTEAITQSVSPRGYQEISLKSLSNLSHSKLIERLQDELIEWLSQKLKIPAHQIDPTHAFADYGIDSVMAVELAQDLEEKLGLSQPLEATIAWNFPTIKSLAEYLSNFKLEKQQGTEKPNEKQQPAPKSTRKNLDLLSEVEMAQLLAEELAMKKGG